MTRIILIRHGQTTWNKVERIRGQVDIPLDELGLVQAEATAKRVARQWQPAAVYCSPLRRAMQTAQPIADLLGQDVRPEPGFIDMDFGLWQGLSPGEVTERWPEQARTWLKAPHLVTFPEGEDLDLVKNRSTAALHRLIGQHGAETIAIVGHTVINRVLLCFVLGIDNSNYWRIGQDTCAINVLEWDEGLFFIQSLNDTCHLQPSALTKAAPPQ
jgi:broad specificity phosphatase PhoE